MMDGHIIPMTAELAAEIAAWKYPGEYAVYNREEGSSTDELLEGGSYALLNSARELIGFYQFGAGARIPAIEEDVYPEGPLDMGLGLRPDICGLGFGEPFVQCGISWPGRSLGSEIYGLRWPDSTCGPGRYTNAADLPLCAVLPTEGQTLSF